MQKFEPKYEITPVVSRALFDIDAIRNEVDEQPVNIRTLYSLRESSRLQSTHYSTKIEGNSLTEKDVAALIATQNTNGNLKGRASHDENEALAYSVAFDWVLANLDNPITLNTIVNIHRLVEGKKPLKAQSKSGKTEFRDGQNVVRDSITGAISYMPPEASDVPELMRALLKWIAQSVGTVPIPVIAAIAHYQFVTIHPYYDGNGRTARLLTTLILHKFGFGLGGIYSLEKYYAEDLQSYYAVLDGGYHHNYYFGRDKTDFTNWIEYFLLGMVKSFANVSSVILKEKSAALDSASLFRGMTERQRAVLTLFVENDEIRSKQIQALFGVSTRTASYIANTMVKCGFLEVGNTATKTRTYKLAKSYSVLL
jgi:Fic family protein